GEHKPRLTLPNGSASPSIRSPATTSASRAAFGPRCASDELRVGFRAMLTDPAQQTDPFGLPAFSPPISGRQGARDGCAACPRGGSHKQGAACEITVKTIGSVVIRNKAGE